MRPRRRVLLRPLADRLGERARLRLAFRQRERPRGGGRRVLLGKFSGKLRDEAVAQRARGHAVNRTARAVQPALAHELPAIVSSVRLRRSKVSVAAKPIARSKSVRASCESTIESGELDGQPPPRPPCPPCDSSFSLPVVCAHAIASAGFVRVHVCITALMPIHFSSRPLLFTKATAPFASSCVHFSKIIEYSVNRAPRPKPRSPRRLNAPSAVFRSSGSRTASSSRSKPFMRTMPSCCAMRFFTHLSSGWPFVNRSTVIEPSPSPIANCARSPRRARKLRRAPRRSAAGFPRGRTPRLIARRDGRRCRADPPDAKCDGCGGEPADADDERKTG